MAKRFKLFSVTLNIFAPVSWTDAQAEAVMDEIEERARGGAEAVGVAIVERFGALASEVRSGEARRPPRPCYDCGSPFDHRHTALCAFKETGDVLDLPMKPRTQWWTGQLPGFESDPPMQVVEGKVS